MNALLGVGHFCEVHGPSLMFCTQTIVTSSNNSEFEYDENVNESNAVPCEACTSIGKESAYISNDEETGLSYISTQGPRKQHLQKLLKYACVRSLSCEAGGNNIEGTMCFGDAERGYVLCNLFKISDSEARGFHRSLTIVLLMRDKVQLLTAWPFFLNHGQELVRFLQDEATKVYTFEDGGLKRSVRLQLGCASRNLPRSLQTLCGLPNIWEVLHMRLTWLLRSIPRAHCEVPITKPDLTLTNTSNVSENNLNLRDFATYLSDELFIAVCHCLTTGVQVVLRGEEIIGDKVLDSLKILLPPGYKKPMRYSEYALPNESMLFAVNSDVALPRPSANMLRIEMLSTNWIVKWEGHVLDRLGTLINAIVRAVKDSKLVKTAFNAHINSLILHWINVAKANVWSGNSVNIQLLRKLGANTDDIPLIQYWSSYIKIN